MFKMRNITKRKLISVSEDVHNRLLKDKLHFENVIGGGKWSISDTINEYLKIIDQNGG